MWWIIAGVALILLGSGAMPVFAIKPGAALSGAPEVQLMRRVVADVLSEYGYQTTVTSGLDSTHLSPEEGGKHYLGLAEDYRSHDIAREDLQPILAEIRARLGGSYYFILENQDTPNEHFHGQFNG